VIQLTNHGVETSLMDDVLNLAREFFNQPIERKRKFSNLIDGKNFQVEGYGTDRVVTQDQILDWSDRLFLRVEPKEERNLAFWPDHPESFRSPTHLTVIDVLLSSLHTSEFLPTLFFWCKRWCFYCSCITNKVTRIVV
jgi:isopenicillin N synthase-like dioxygenase